MSGDAASVPGTVIEDTIIEIFAHTRPEEGRKERTIAQLRWMLGTVRERLSR